SGGWWRVGRLEEVGGGCGGSEKTSTNLPNLHNLPNLPFLVHPHGANRHAGERPVAQAAGDARVEHAGQPEVRADAEAEDESGREVADDERKRRLHVRHDAHGGSLWIDAPAEREPGRDDER